MSETVSVSIDGHLAVVTLNRPEKANAVSLEMFDALGDKGEILAADKSIRAVVLHGAGDNFCAGIDVGIFQQDAVVIDAKSMAPVEGSPANRFQRAAYAWRELPVPVICAISGVAFGAGLQIALGADLRYATADARLSIMEIKWGLVPDLAISTTLRDILPVDRVKELAWSGRVVDAKEALDIGLVTELYDDPFEAAMQSLQPGELSGLVETSYGFHIIRLNERKDAGAVPYDEVQERIEEFLKQRGLQELIEQELDLLRSTAAIEVFI